MQTEYFDCECHSPEHILRVMYDEDDKENNWDCIYIDFQFYPSRNVFKRIFIAFKYIFGIKSNNSPWEDMILKRKDVPRLINLLNKIENKKVEEELK